MFLGGAVVNAALNSDVLPKVEQVAPSVHSVVVEVRMSPTAPGKLWL
jgi:hypothetical protein